jgi:hypothetical protein
MRSEVVTKTDIPIRSVTETLTIQPHLAVHIHPIELHPDPRIRLDVSQLETAPIPPDASRFVAAHIPLDCRRFKRRFERPVMRQIKGPPRRIILLG